MADYEVKKAPEFTATARKLETTDRAHADLFNDLYQKLFDNDSYLKNDSSNKLDADNGDIANTQVSEFEESSEALPVPVAGDKEKTLWGKLKKWQQDCLAKFGNYVLTSMITNQHLNDTNRIPTSALVYLMQQSITQLNRDLATVDSLLKRQGIDSPEAENGIVNTQYVESGFCQFRKANGVCFLHFDLVLKNIDVYSTVVVSGLPHAKMNIYKDAFCYQNQNRDRIVFFSHETELRCGMGVAGRYYASLAYPSN